MGKKIFVLGMISGNEEINHFEDNEKFYLIMPYASKGQLYSLLRRQVRFDQRTAAQYKREVIEAVRYIHSFSPKITEINYFYLSFH